MKTSVAPTTFAPRLLWLCLPLALICAACTLYFLSLPLSFQDRWLLYRAQQGQSEALVAIERRYRAAVPELTKLSPAQVALMRAFAKAGLPIAHLELGQYLVNIGDFQAATPWLQLSAESDAAQAHYLLGILHRDGLAGRKDYLKACRSLRASAETGHSEGQFEISALVIQKQCLAEDSLVEQWLTEAAGAGHQAAQLLLGRAYWQGDFGARDENSAVQWLEPLALGGHVEAQRILGTLYFQGNSASSPVQAVRWLSLAARQGDPEALYRLAYLSQNGIGMEADPQRAARLLKHSAEFGHAQAQLKLAEAYLSGYGIERKPAKAIFWFKQSASQGELQAMYRLGQVYRDGGLGVVNPEQALFWLEQAAEQGLAGAQHDLGIMLAQAANTSPDRAKAEYWLKKAAAQNYPAATDFHGSSHNISLVSPDN